jgi:hypothetical protein
LLVSRASHLMTADLCPSASWDTGSPFWGPSGANITFSRGPGNPAVSSFWTMWVWCWLQARLSQSSTVKTFISLLFHPS